MTKSVIYLFFATLVLTTLPAKSWDEFRGYDPGLWDMEFRTQYYKATGNYSHGGGEVNSLTSGTSYSLMNFDLGVRWTHPPDGDSLDRRISPTQVQVMDL